MRAAPRRRGLEEVAIIGARAVPVGRIQTPAGAERDVVEHEILSQLVADTIEAAGVSRDLVGSMVFSEPHVYTRQKYFSTFMTAYLGMKCQGAVIEVLPGHGRSLGWETLNLIDHSGKNGETLTLIFPRRRRQRGRP